MTHAMRETMEDRNHQLWITEAICKHLGCKYTTVETEGKYKVDAWLWREKEIVGFLECKWLESERFFGLNVPKYIHGCELAATTDSLFLYGVRVPGKIGFIKVHSGVWPEATAKPMMAGGTQKGRQPNWDDVEPMMMFDREQITWVRKR